MNFGLAVTNGGLEPYGFFSALTKSDDTVLTGLRGIYVGGTGDVIVKDSGGAGPITFKAVPVGTILPISITRLMAATTATLIIGLK